MSDDSDVAVASKIAIAEDQFCNFSFTFRSFSVHYRCKGEDCVVARGSVVESVESVAANIRIVLNEIRRTKTKLAVVFVWQGQTSAAPLLL